MSTEVALIKRVLTCFEQSSERIKYDKIYLLEDGPNDIKQITVSFGITEWGNLKKLLELYRDNDGKYASILNTYRDRVGRVSLVSEKQFIDTLSLAGKEDPVMQKCHDLMFESIYITPALEWCNKNQLILPLSKLVIADSYLQSGSILAFLRNRFSEKVPVNGGDEKEWIKSYCNVRREWLQTHSRKILNKTIYRMDFMKEQIINDNWYLKKFPIVANGVKLLA
jgi:chitosanase